MRIAQDLHDGPAQDVGLALLRLEAVGGSEEEAHRAASAQEDIQLMRAALSGAIKDIREIAAGLRLPEMEGLSLAEVVERAVQEHREKTGNRVAVSVTSGLPTAGLPAKIAVYRVVQEAVNNAYQHAGGGEAVGRARPRSGVGGLGGAAGRSQRPGAAGVARNEGARGDAGRHSGGRVGTRQRYNCPGGDSPDPRGGVPWMKSASSSWMTTPCSGRASSAR